MEYVYFTTILKEQISRSQNFNTTVCFLLCRQPWLQLHPRFMVVFLVWQLVHTLSSSHQMIWYFGTGVENIRLLKTCGIPSITLEVSSLLAQDNEMQHP